MQQKQWRSGSGSSGWAGSGHWPTVQHRSVLDYGPLLQKRVRHHPNSACVPIDAPRSIGETLGVDGRVLAVRVARPVSVDRRDFGVRMSNAAIDADITDEEQPGAHTQYNRASTQTRAEEGHVVSEPTGTIPGCQEAGALKHLLLPCYFLTTFVGRSRH